MSIIDKLISSIVPHVCLGCGYEGALICPDCVEAVGMVSPRCYYCQRTSPDFRTCGRCERWSSLSKVYIATGYEGLAKDLLWRLKFQSAQAAVGSMAGFMAPLLKGAGDIWLVPVPTATKRARSRGYDQAKLLARRLARETRLPYSDCLRRVGQTHQVGASREERRQQLNGAFSITGRHRRSVRGRAFILVDDVVTTGATLEAAAVVLRGAGAVSVEAVAFAQPAVLGNRTRE